MWKRIPAILVLCVGIGMSCLPAFSLDLRASYPNAGACPAEFQAHVIDLGAKQITQIFKHPAGMTAVSFITDNNGFQGCTVDGPSIIPGNYCFLAGTISEMPDEKEAHDYYLESLKGMTAKYSGGNLVSFACGDEGMKGTATSGSTKDAQFLCRKGRRVFQYSSNGARVISDETFRKAVMGEAAAPSGNAALIAFLRKVKGGMLSPLNDVSDAALDRAIQAHPGPAFRIGRLAEAVRRYDELCATPLPPRKETGWVDWEKLMAYLDDKLNPLAGDTNDKATDAALDLVGKLVPQAAAFVSHRTFFKEAHDALKLTRDALLMPAIEEKAYEAYRNERDQGQGELNAYDFAIVKNSYSVRVDPSRIPALKKNLEARYQYEKLAAKQREMVQNRKENLNRLLPEYQQDIDLIVYDAAENK
ncbi:MAG TPA: hypothetical protein PLP29_06030 [Candidatus Ozemobacteraceae bacterium]|nr:hypothetical protein [Candidatus Ozemobacteraceae bacterium]